MRERGPARAAAAAVDDGADSGWPRSGERSPSPHPRTASSSVRPARARDDVRVGRILRRVHSRARAAPPLFAGRHGHQLGPERAAPSQSSTWRITSWLMRMRGSWEADEEPPRDLLGTHAVARAGPRDATVEIDRRPTVATRWTAAPADRLYVLGLLRTLPPDALEHRPAMRFSGG